MKKACRFFRRLTRPARLGIVLPLSASLADSLTRDAAGAECVLVIGPSIGVLDALARRVPVSRIVVLEPNHSQAEDLRERFHGVSVHEAYLPQVLPLLRRLPLRTLVLSSLPFRAYPSCATWRAEAALSWFLNQSSARRLVQHSFLPSPPFRAPEDLAWHLRETVSRNFPPALVWELLPRNRAALAAARKELAQLPQMAGLHARARG